MTVTDVDGVPEPEAAATEAPPAEMPRQESGIAQVTGLDVTFTDLTYTVKAKKGPLDIISSLNGHLQPARLTALMGPSGSGKTTLMDVVAGRKTGGNIKGEILFGGSAVPKKKLRYICGYVEQFDTLVDELTVRDFMLYTAHLKLPLKMPRSEKVKRAEEVMESLRLVRCADTVIGNDLNRGISGGQCKRVNIALALINQPPIIFLDEPTSGLDSCMANEVCHILKQVSEAGHTVVATVHSPTGYAFSKFDHVMMLASGGRPIYAGGRADITTYFSSLGLNFPGGVVPLPDWLVDVTSSSSDGESYLSKRHQQVAQKLDVDFVERWQGSAEGRASQDQVKNAVGQLKGAPANAAAMGDTGPGQLWALRTILAFRMVAHYQNAEFLGPRIGSKVFIAVFTLTLYIGVGDEMDSASIVSTANTLYFFCALCGYGAAEYMPSLCLDRALLYREKNDGCYRTITYYAGKFIEEFILSILTSALFTLIVFFGMELQGSILVFFAAHYITNMIGIVLACMFAALAPTMEAANAMLPTYVTTCMYFGGLFILFDQIPDYWYWYSYTSFLRYSWALFMLNQFDGEVTGREKIFLDAETLQYQNILEFYQITGDFMGEPAIMVGMLFVLLIVFASLGILGMSTITHIKR